MSLSDYIKQINDNMNQYKYSQQLATQQEMDIEKMRLLSALQAQQDTANGIHQSQSGTSAPNWGGGGGTTGGVGIGAGGYQIPSAFPPAQSLPTFPTLPSPTGNKVTVSFTDAFGHAIPILVDSAYIGVLNFISHAHRNSTSDAYKISTRPSMDDGEFSEEELERAQVIIDELGAKPKAEAHG